MDRRRWIFVVSTAFALAFDQLSKIWARHALLPIYPRSKIVIPHYWEFRYSENPGAAFGLLRDIPGAHYFFVPIALGLIVGGALGNAFERVAFGRVTDFVVWKIGTHEWDTFNVADAALVIGILG